MLTIKVNKDLLHTQIPNTFIDDYMQNAEPVYSLIYIYLLRYVDEPDKTEPASIAKAFDITERKCVKALKYWDEAGLLKLEGTAKKAPAPVKTVPVYEQERPVYSPEELEAYAKQGIIADLFSYAQGKLLRMLRYNDLNFLYSLYDWLRLDIAVIKKLIEYCADNGHTNISYIESVALDWAHKGIKTPNEADEYTKTFANTYKDILKALGLSSANVPPKQVELIDKWLKEYQMPLEVILEACDKTVIGASSPSFSYLSSIIERWHKAGVMTLDDVIERERDYTVEKAPKTQAAPRRKNRFANFEGRKIDHIEIEKLEDQYIDSLVKGQLL